MPDKKKVKGIVRLRRKIEEAIRHSSDVDKLLETAKRYDVKYDEIDLELPKQGTE